MKKSAVGKRASRNNLDVQGGEKLSAVRKADTDPTDNDGQPDKLQKILGSNLVDFSSQELRKLADQREREERREAERQKSTTAKETLSPLFTVQQVADLLQVSDRTVRNLVSRGDLSRVKMGRMVRFEEAAVRNYLEQHRNPASPPP